MCLCVMGFVKVFGRRGECLRKVAWNMEKLKIKTRKKHYWAVEKRALYYLVNSFIDAR